MLDPTEGQEGQEADDALLTQNEPHEALRRSRLLYDRDVEFVLEPALPVFEEFEELASTYTVDPFGHAASVAHALVSLQLCEPAPADDLTVRYEVCLRALDTTMGKRTKDRLIALISHRLAGESDCLPAGFVSDTVWTLADNWATPRRCHNTDDRTALSLLSIACRLLARDADEQLAVVVARLLALEPGSLVSDLGIRRRRRCTGEVLTRLLHRIKDISAAAERTLSCLWLLKLAVALDQRDWCDVHAEQLLDMVGVDGRDRLLPSEAEYVMRPWGGTLDE